MTARRPLLVVTCEHGGNAIPRRFAGLFREYGALLATHRGYDIGAAPVARAVARAFDAPLFVATTSRLLVDLNRSLGHPKLFSDATRALPENLRAVILREHYEPHRERVLRAVERALSTGRRVVHVGVHSFTPVLHGVVRRADVGLLYDPRRGAERAFSAAWQMALHGVSPGLVVRRNYPYRGTSDGLTTALRKAFRGPRYIGIEIELNQAKVGSRAAISEMSGSVALSLSGLVDG